MSPNVQAIPWLMKYSGRTARNKRESEVVYRLEMCGARQLRNDKIDLLGANCASENPYGFLQQTS